MKVTKEQYDAACRQKKDAEGVIAEYHKQVAQTFQERLESGVPFTDEELIYSARSLCPCGHGLAYPKDCSPSHYWDCSAILKGIADQGVKHTGQLPFAFYEVKSESEHNGTTRGVFRPQQAGGGE